MDEPTADAQELDAPFERAAGTERIIAFTDAAVAIALTLLVLPLMESVNSVQEAHASQSLGEWLAEHGAAVGGFLMSFVLVATYWTLHHQAMLQVRAFRGRMLAANFLWLLGIVILPVTSGIIMAFEDDLLQRTVYIGTIVLIALSLIGIEVEILRSPGALAPGTGAREAMLGHLASALGMLTASLVCFVLVGFTPLGWLGMFGMALIPLLRRPLLSLLHRPVTHAA